MRLYDFIDLVGKEDILKTVGPEPWKPILLDYIPFKAVTPAPGYLFTLGSSNISLPTTSIYNLTYSSGIDVFRTDFDSRDPNEPLINIDRYVAGKTSINQYAVYKIPLPEYHWPKFNDPIVKEVPLDWQGFVKSMLQRRK